MKNYAKVIMYVYPLLGTVEKDYEEHIRNKALLSYDNTTTARRLAEYLAEEILCMRKLEWLKGKVEELLNALSDEERTLVCIRYFGQRKKIKALRGERANGEKGAFSERSYFRRQARLGQKLGALLEKAGLSEEVYKRELVGVDIVKKIHNFVEAGKDKHISADEKRWLTVAE